MKTKLITILSALILASVVQAAASRYTYNNFITRSYPTTPQTQLHINNQFGNIIIVEWGKPEVSIRAVLTGKGETDKKARQMLDKLSVSFEAAGNDILVETLVRSAGKGDGSFQVNYTVSMPPNIRMVIENSFGNITIGNLNNPSYIKAAWGNLTIENITADITDIDIQGGNLSMGNAPELHLRLANGNALLGNVGELVLRSETSNFTARKVDVLHLDQAEFGKLNVEELGEMTVQKSSSSIDIGTLRTALRIDQQEFGNVTVREVLPGFRSVYIDAWFGNVVLGTKQGANYDYSLSSTFGDVSVSGKTLSTSEFIAEPRYNRMVGIAGTKDKQGGKISVSVEHGNVSIEHK